jgi:hypothetical protein
MNLPDLYEVRQRLGGTVSRGGLTWQGPGPAHSRRDMSLKVDIQDDGRVLVHSFANDPLAACEAHLGFRVGGSRRMEAAPLARPRRPPGGDLQQRTATALRIWGQADGR